jgi:hypothetical protein
MAEEMLSYSRSVALGRGMTRDPTRSVAFTGGVRQARFMRVTANFGNIGGADR